MLVEPTTIAVCLAIEAMAVRIIDLLLNTPFMRYGIARHIGGEYS
jgi:hypothetical protein